MARTRQKRKAKRREQQLKSTPRTAAARQQPTNPAEEAVIQAAESLEVADELEQIELGEEPEEAQATATEDRDSVSAETAEAAETKPARKEERLPEPRQERRRERKPAPERRKEKEPRRRGRVTNFLVQVWAELRRVQWPDRNQVTQATGVVVVFCFIAGAYLALWDFLFSKLVTSIL
jgi:preprotein translocase subunit SecE